MDPARDPPATFSFGRFQVLPHRRELLADGQPLKLGGRAYDVLMTLIEARGAVVSKDALMARVWPDRIVEENALQVQMSALRAALGPDRELVRTVSGRGYQFTGELRRLVADKVERAVVAEAAAEPRPPHPPTNLPELVSELIGRDDELRDVVSLASSHRLVTLTGPGGIGKTRLALAVARELLPEFADGVWLAELAPLSDPSLVPATVAAAVGMEPGTSAAGPEHVARVLSGKPLLLVLDNCEHVVDAAAAMAEAVLRAGSVARIIATSREPLRVEGERVYPVPPLTVPAEDLQDGVDFLRYGAARLFLDRVRAAEPRFALDRRVEAVIASICRQLDGIPLAIELAAARAAALGIEGLAARLNDRFRVLTGGRRTAMPRHRTLRATLDWSFDLLPESERVVLRRLSIFAGLFSLESASAVVAGAGLTPSDVIEGVANLVAKSLVAANAEESGARYSLLDTTRAYALEKLRESGEREALARRHAEYFRDLFERAEAEWERQPTPEWLAGYRLRIDNLRAALDWAFAPGGDTSVGVALAANAVPLWLELSLLTECRNWTGKAVACLGPGDRGTRSEMLLQAALGFSLMVTTALTSNARAALMRALEIAERLQDADYQLRTLTGLCTFRLRFGDFRGGLELARRCEAIAREIMDPAAVPTADRLLGVALSFLADYPAARTHLQRAVDEAPAGSRRGYAARFGTDHRANALDFLAIVLWQQGFPEQALRTSRASIEEARRVDHPISLCLALFIGGGVIARRVGDLDTTRRLITELLDQAERYSLAPYRAFGLGVNGLLTARRGDPASGVRQLQDALETLNKAQYFIYHGVFLTSFAEVHSAAGHPAEALKAADDALEHVQQHDALWHLPEALRIKGELLLLHASNAPAAAEALFRQALDCARQQGALSLELRAATSLARLLRDQGQTGEARDLLASVYQRFTEGFETADLQSAKRLLDELIAISKG
jgi:predicted ATPase/DNA-binding winged helix-turn-helix (wHTH) protein